MHFELIFAAMLAVATAVAVVARRLDLPFTVALVLAGLVLGVVRPFEAPHLTKDLLYAVFLPGLLFEASYHLPWQAFRANKLAILSLALPGLVVAVALTALLLAPAVVLFGLEPEFLLVHALVFGALIAATDPIAVSALFKSMGAPKRLLVLIEGESLINDGAAVVVFALAVQIATGGTVTVGYAVGQFALIGALSVLIGGVTGMAVSLATRRIDDPLIEITLTTIAAYGSFAVAEHFGYSGVIACVVAGIICGNYGARVGMSATTRIAVESFWEYVAFVFNSFVFLLIGLEVSLAELARSWLAILVAFAAVLLARALVVAAATFLFRRTRERIPWSWAAVLTWGGLRGALSMVLVLGLATDFPHRSFLVTITFGVVLLTILVQGLSMAPLLRRLGVVQPTRRHVAYDLAQGRLRAAHAALRELETLGAERRVAPELLSDARADYERRIAAAERDLERLRPELGSLRAEEQHALARHMLMIEKAAVHDAARDGFIERDAAGHIVGDIDVRLHALESSRERTAHDEAGKP
ncbi:MAG: Na+/H+ antiporter [Myxococcota bacterium]